jgi:hypothetical protein
MPRGSAPGERRGGRKKGTPNRRTLMLKNAIGKYTDRPRAIGSVDSIDFLTKIYQDEEQPLMVRIDAARVVAPFERPRLRAMTSRESSTCPGADEISRLHETSP